MFPNTGSIFDYGGKSDQQFVGSQSVTNAGDRVNINQKETFQSLANF